VSGRAAGSLDFVGDVHLDEGDAAVAEFVSFLGELGRTSRRVVLLGDLFNLWIGLRRLERPHQTTVLVALADLRRQGVAVRYLEGNRDYRIHGSYAGTAIDDASDHEIVERFAGRTIWAAHGDLVNTEDRQYRLWRAVSRSALAWRVVRMLPGVLTMRLVGSLEARMRSTNLAHKRTFPERAFSLGHDTVVLGHFHVEKEIRLERGRVLVVPEWKGARRHLRVEHDGEIGFVDSRY